MSFQNKFSFLFSKSFLIFIFLSSLICFTYSTKFGSISYEKISCHGKKPLGEKTCALYLSSIEGTTISPYIQIKSRCHSNEFCSKSNLAGNENTFQCLPFLSARRPGQSCYYNADCVTNFCDEGICTGFGEGKKCDPDFPQCNHEFSCSSELKKCVRLLPEGATCRPGFNSCDYGLKCNKNLYKCQKIGSQDDGTDVGDEPMLCKTGITYHGKCVRVKKNGKCEKNEQDLFICKRMNLAAGDEKNVYEDDEICENYVGEKTNPENYACKSTLGKQENFKKYMKEYQKVDIAEIKRNMGNLYDENDFKYNFGDAYLSKLDMLYYQSDIFIARGYMNPDNGKTKREFNCEVNWMLKYIGGNQAGMMKLSVRLFIGSLILILL